MRRTQLNNVHAISLDYPLSTRRPVDFRTTVPKPIPELKSSQSEKEITVDKRRQRLLAIKEREDQKQRQAKSKNQKPSTQSEHRPASVPIDPEDQPPRKVPDILLEARPSTIETEIRHTARLVILFISSIPLKIEAKRMGRDDGARSSCKKSSHFKRT